MVGESGSTSTRCCPEPGAIAVDKTGLSLPTQLARTTWSLQLQVEE